MDSNHRFSGCEPDVFAARRRDHFAASAGDRQATLDREILRLSLLPIAAARRRSVSEVGVEPTGTRLSTWSLFQFAYPDSSSRGFRSCT